MKSYIKQKVTINGQYSSQTTSRGAFGQLELVEEAICQARPDLGTCWLAQRPNIVFIFGTLLHCGKVSVFSLEDKIRVDIEWEVVLLTDGLLSPSIQPPAPLAPGLEAIMNEDPAAKARREYRAGCDAPVVGE